jgi:hypothetical protein
MAAKKKATEKAPSKKKSPNKPKSGKVKGWNATYEKAFKKFKKIGILAKSAIAGTKGMFKQISSLFTGGYAEGISEWKTIPGSKAEKKALAEEYTKSGFFVKGGKVMLNKMSKKDTFRIEKGTGRILRYSTDARSKKRHRDEILTYGKRSNLPELKEGEQFAIYFRRGSGKRAFYEPRMFDSSGDMEKIMDDMYSQTFSNWREHIEIMNAQ